MPLLISLLSLFFIFSCTQLPKHQSFSYATDAHMHIQYIDVQDDMEFNANRALFAADSIGLKRAIVLSNAYSKMAYKDHARTQNSFVAKEVAKNPQQLAGACAVNPMSDWAKDELKRCHQDGLRVLKLHTMASGMDLKNKSHQKVLKDILTQAEKFKYTILIHGNFPKNKRGNEAEILLDVLAQFPQTRFIIGHLLGMEYEHLKDFKHPNFLVEVSAIPIWTKTPEQKKNLISVMRAVGMQKFIFGSDWPVIHPAEMLKALQELTLSSSELEGIIFKNAQALDDLFH